MMVGRHSNCFVREGGTVEAASRRGTSCGGSVRLWRADFLVRGVFGFMVMVSCAWLSMAAPQATGAGTAQDAKDVCAPEQAAYQKTASASNSSNATNTGALNVAEAYDKITSEAGHRETCKYLRDETVSGEDANVYSDVFAAKSGTANGTVWISKKNGWVLKREVDVEMAGVGKGHQAIVFEYPRK
jgi:hypothetical protein